MPLTSRNTEQHEARTATVRAQGPVSSAVERRSHTADATGSNPVPGTTRMSRTCVCTHPRAVHEHHRTGSDCALCPCERWRSPDVRSLPRYRACVKRLAVVLVLAPVLAGCGGGSSSSSSFKTPQEIASKLGCTSPEPATEVMAREGIDCSYDGSTLEIVTFNDNGQRDGWAKIAKKLGGGVYVVGDKWLVDADSTAQAEKIAGVVGGKVT